MKNTGTLDLLLKPDYIKIMFKDISLMVRWVLCPAVTVLFVAGCSLYRVDSSDMSSDFHPPKVSADQVVYLESLDKPYDVIGVVDVTTERSVPLAGVLEQMRYEAAILGADAVTEVVTDRAPLRVRYTAKAVVFK